ncbi:MAG TPA: tetratricopeptide repeat protein [Ktedonobacteraceae bacterium]|nr:tetratricopeptide repeat protein [Ktedonobacteraceae bacterium]
MQTPETTPQPRLRLTEARTQRGMSQQDVANRIGTTHVNVSRWERGITKPSPYFRRKLSALFGKTEQELDLLPTPPQSASASSAPVAPPAPALSPASEALYDPAIPLQPAIPLIGRDEDLARLKRRLRAGGSIALTALNGLPGVGKTALSIAIAHDLEIRAHFRDGVLWAALGPNPNMPGLLSRWGTLLGVSANQMATLNNHEAWARALRTAIGSRAMLLVIDDAWQLEEALTFKVGGPNCAHLVTTRFPYIASHISIEGATLIHELNEEESMSLLRLLAPQAVESEAEKAHDLVHAVGGLPLALTLMGNYLRKQAYSGQSRRIVAALQRLSNVEERLNISEPHAPVETHPSLPIETPLSLQSVIAVTDQQLSAEASAALYALSVFPPKPNSFSEEAALAIAACTVDTLDVLSDAGLLESNSSGRYTLHQTIADYAHLHLKDHAPHQRLIAYVTDYVEQHKKDYELLELESNTILAALTIASEQSRQADLVRAVCAFAPFMLVRALYSLAELHLKRAYEAAVALKDDDGLTSVLLYLGRVAQQQGNFAQAEAQFQEGLTIARRTGNQELICALLNDLGNVSWRRGESMQAETYLQEGLTIARQIGNPERICGLLRVLGSVLGSRGDYAQAEVYLQEGLSLARQIGDREQICVLLMNLGTTTGAQGNHRLAETYFLEGLALVRLIGHREQTCVLLLNLGGVADAQGDYPKAEKYFQEALVLARQIEQRQWISAILISLGLMTRKQNNYAQAELYFQEGLSLARQIGSPHIIANALYEYGILHLDQNQPEVAEAVFQEMLAIIPEGGQDLIALAQYGLARVAAAQGDIGEARKLGEASVLTLEKIGHRDAREVRGWLDILKKRN